MSRNLNGLDVKLKFKTCQKTISDHEYSKHTTENYQALFEL